MAHSLHNHTNRSDGKLDAVGIVEKAIEGGLEFVGISDHYGTSGTKCIEDFRSYIDELRRVQKEFEDQIPVLAGVEIDASHDRTDVESLDFEGLNSLDYVLFEHAQDELWKGMPVWELMGVRKRIRPPCGLAHNDLGRNFGEIRTDYLAEVLVSNAIFVELNCGRRYSKMGKFYYELAESLVEEFVRKGVKLSLGCDGHRDDAAEVSKAVDFVNGNDMEKSLVTAKDFFGRS
jgi:DNA polymerase (family 10)